MSGRMRGWTRRWCKGVPARHWGWSAVLWGVWSLAGAQGEPPAPPQPVLDPASATSTVQAEVPVGAGTARATLPSLDARWRHCNGGAIQGPEGQLGLEAVLQSVVCQHAKVRSGTGLAQQAQAAVRQAEGQRLPSVTLYSGIDSSRDADTEWAATVSLDWVLFDFGQRSAAIDQARVALAATLDEQRAEVLTALGEAAQRYTEAQAGLGQLEAASDNLKTAIESARLAQARQSAGAASVSERLQAQTALAQARLARSRARGAWLSARGALAVAMGAPASEALVLAPDERSVPIDQSLDIPMLVAEARAAHPRVAAARGRLVAAQSQEKSLRSQRWGAIAVGAQTGRSRASSESAVSEHASATLGWTVPLFDRRVISAQLLDAQGQIQQRNVDVEEALRQVELAVWQQAQSVISEQEGVQESQTVLDSAEDALRVATERYRQGAGAFNDVLTAQTAVATARVQAVEARANVRRAQWLLAAAVGRLGAWTPVSPTP